MASCGRYDNLSSFQDFFNNIYLCNNVFLITTIVKFNIDKVI